jgi:hypothetical protein
MAILRLCSVLLLLTSLLSQPVLAQEGDQGPVLFVNTRYDVLRYNAVSGAFIDTFIHSEGLWIEELRIGPDNNLYVLLASTELNFGYVRRYNIETGALIDVFIDLKAEGFRSLTTMEFGPDGDLYVGGQLVRDNIFGNAIMHFDGQNGAVIDYFFLQTGGVLVMDFGLEGHLYIGDASGIGLQEYDAATGTFIRVFIPDILVWAVLFLPDGRLYIAQGDTAHIALYDGQNGQLTNTFVDAKGVNFAFGPDSNLYVLDETQYTIKRYNGTTGAFIDVFIQNDSFEFQSYLLFYPPGTPPPLPSAAEHVADVAVTHRSSPNLQVAPNDIVVDTIKVANHGLGDASEVIVSMPFDPTQVEILDASFSRPTAWVSQLRTDSLEIRTGPLGSESDTITATVRLRIRPKVAPGTALPLQLGYRWLNAEVHGGGDGNSNRLPLTAGQTTIDAPWYPLAITPGSAPPGTSLHLSSASFAPGEPVALWYNGPQGATEVGRRSADANGALEVVFDSAGLASGSYSMVAYGLWSEITAVGVFQIEKPK